MNQGNSKPGAIGRELLLLAMLAAVTSTAPGCSLFKKPSHAPSIPPAENQTPSTSAAAPTSVQITYAKTNDSLKSVLVTKFTGASILRTRDESGGEAALVRFDGGVPVWQFHSNRSVLNPLNAIGKNPDRVATVDFGKLPPGFMQDIPDVGPPAPLDPGGYYVFVIERASGATSYQVVKVNSDLTLEVYDAEPRAGTSYKLCCNVSSDFAEPTPADDTEQPDAPPTDAPPMPPPSDSDEP